MHLEDIMEYWGEDSRIDPTDLSNEALKTPKLHHKYYEMYVRERLMLRKMEATLKQLKLAKFEFYTQGPHEETPEHWKLPAIGKILRSDVATYIDADPDIIKETLRIAVQSEKVDALESIIRVIGNRGYAIKNSIDYMRFMNGT